jgi:hypothetical protein
VRLAREMYDELAADGKRKHTVAQIAEFGVTRPTIYRHLTKTTATTRRQPTKTSSMINVSYVALQLNRTPEWTQQARHGRPFFQRSCQ